MPRIRQRMVDQYLRDLTESLAEVKQELPALWRRRRVPSGWWTRNTAEVAKYDDLARQALKAGNEGDARAFLAKKQQLAAKGESLAQAYAAAHENASKMRQMHDKLVNDIETLKGRREAVKAKVARCQDAG